MSIARLPLALLGAALLSACTDIAQPDVTTNRYAALSFIGTNASASTVRATPNIVFLEGFASLPNSTELATDQCQPFGVDTTTLIVQGLYKGTDTIPVTVGAREVPLTYRSPLKRYETLTGAPITYTAGETAQTTIPASGTVFPSASISLKLAEPLVPGPVVVPTVVGDPLVVTWNATNDASTVILLFLRYANPSTSTYGNEQIYCQLKDDGRVELPYSQLGVFFTSPVNRRSLRLVRYRTNVVEVDAHTILHAASQVDTIITTFR